MKISIRTAQNVLIDYPLASLGDRISAYFIDVLIVVGYALAVFFIKDISQNSLPDFVWYIFGLVYLLYDLICEILLEGQTIGKRQMGIKVVRRDGSQATWSSYFLRWLIGLFEARFFMFYGVIAMVTIIVTGRGQRLGDLAAGTCVIKLVPPKTITLDALQEDENYQPTFPQVTQLQDKDVRIMKEVMENYNKNFNAVLVRQVAEKLKTLLEIESNLPDYTFLKTLVKDYEYLTARM